MLKSTYITIATFAICLGLVPSAQALIQQTANVQIKPTSGSSTPKAGTYVKLNSYLATRDPASTKYQKATSPVGKVFMTFPAGSSVNKSATPTCNLSEYATPSQLAAQCSASQVGSGWALLTNGTIPQSPPQEQITGAPSACAGDDQWMRLFLPGVVSCVPGGKVWVKVTAYQGAILKAQWWCYGDQGNTKTIPDPAHPGKTKADPSAACTNKQSGGDANGAFYASNSKTGGTFNDGLNRKGMNGCNIIFANDNSIAKLSFGATVNGCKNQLTAIIPAMNGTGSGLGELTGGWVLSDFKLDITAANYLKSGPCPRNKQWNVSSRFVYSRMLGETKDPNPSSLTVNSSTNCRS